MHLTRGPRVSLECLPPEVVAPVRSVTQPALPARDALSIREHRANLRRTLAEEDRRQLLDVIARTRGNMSEAARALGISRTSLYRRLARERAEVDRG